MYAKKLQEYFSEKVIGIEELCDRYMEDPFVV